jgi:hypothetical protein
VSRGNIAAIGQTDVTAVRSALDRLHTTIETLLALVDGKRQELSASTTPTDKTIGAMLDVLANDYKRRLKQADDWYAAYIDTKPVDRFNRLGQAYDLVNAAEFSTRVSAQATKDFITITFSAKPRSTSLLGVPLAVPPVPEQTIEIPTCGGIKLDFSTGLMFSDLVNHTYTLRDTGIARPPDTLAGRLKRDTIPAKQILRDPLDAASFGAGAMLHVYWRGFPTYDWSLPAVTLGVFTSNASNIVYTLGLATTFNALNERFSASVGGAFTKVKRLDTPFQDGHIVPTSEIGSLNNQITRDQFVHGWYFALSWNLP